MKGILLLLPLLVCACTDPPASQGKLLSSRSFDRVKMNVCAAPQVEEVPEALFVAPSPEVELVEPVAEAIIDFADILPEFPGGKEEMLRYFSRNVHYPTIALEAYIEGTVYVQFKVLPDGSISEESILRSVSPYLDKEALRVVRAMPKWAPAQSSGRRVSKTVVVPLHFKID